MQQGDQCDNHIETYVWQIGATRATNYPQAGRYHPSGLTLLRVMSSCARFLEAVLMSILFDIFKFLGTDSVPKQAENRLKVALTGIVASRSHGNVRLQKGRYFTKHDKKRAYEQLRNYQF